MYCHKLINTLSLISKWIVRWYLYSHLNIYCEPCSLKLSNAPILQQFALFGFRPNTEANKSNSKISVSKVRTFLFTKREHYLQGSFWFQIIDHYSEKNKWHHVTVPRCSTFNMFSWVYFYLKFQEMLSAFLAIFHRCSFSPKRFNLILIEPLFVSVEVITDLR